MSKTDDEIIKEVIESFKVNKNSVFCRPLNHTIYLCNQREQERKEELKKLLLSYIDENIGKKIDKIDKPFILMIIDEVYKDDKNR